MSKDSREMTITHAMANDDERFTAYSPRVSGTDIDLRLDANESCVGPERWAQWSSAISESTVTDYPSGYAEFEAAIASRLGVYPDRVLLTAGADDAIERAIAIAVQDVPCSGPEVVVVQPTFEMIERYAARHGAKLRGPWSMDPAYPIDAVLDSITPRTAAVAVVSPNNPTGAVIEAQALLQLSDRLRAVSGGMLLIDLAYTEFADVDLTSVGATIGNAIVVRTFSKAWGMAGLRLGYAIGPSGDEREWLKRLRAVGHPYAVSGLSAEIGKKWYADGAESVRANVAAVRYQRSELSELFQSLGFRVDPSQGNFILARGRRADWLADGLRSLSIAIRSFQNRPGLEEAVRITCPGTSERMSRLRSAARTVIRPEAVLFDLDGVIADVSSSYRLAIQHSAADFGAQVTLSDIKAAKRSGNANNDWILTHRLITQSGIIAQFEDVKECFQKHYLGTDGKAGLSHSEGLLTTPGMLKRIGQQFKIGIVTGRPRAEAHAFLERHGIRDTFQCLVCMEDAPAKPDPAPVWCALQQLGVQHAWMLGDTPDDVEAAKRAGVLPIGVLAPGDGSDAEAALLRSGACRVLPTVANVEEILR